MEIDKMNKGQVLLKIYLDLSRNPSMLRTELQSRYRLTNRTSRRYLKDLENLGCVIERTILTTKELDDDGLPHHEQLITLVKGI